MEAEAGPPLLSNCIEHTAPCWFLPFHSIAVRTVQSKKAAEVSVGKKLRWKTLWVAVERQLQRGSCQLVVCKLLEKLLLKLAVILLKHRFCGAPETTLKLCNNLEKLTHAHTHTVYAFLCQLLLGEQKIQPKHIVATDSPEDQYRFMKKDSTLAVLTAGFTEGPQTVESAGSLSSV